MIVPIALALIRLKRRLPHLAAAVEQARARRSGKPDPDPRRAGPYPRLHRPSEN